MMASERLAMALALLLAAVGVYNGVNVLTDHLGSPDFPPHAKFHAALGGAYMVLLSLAAGGIAWHPALRRVGRGQLLAAVLATIPLGFFVAVAVVPAGSPSLSYAILAAGAVAMALVVAVLLFQPGHDGTREPAPTRPGE